MRRKAKPEKLARNVYEQELRRLQIELCHLQEQIEAHDKREIVILEGRNTAGKHKYDNRFDLQKMRSVPATY